jgi:DNA replication protein DnaC
MKDGKQILNVISKQCPYEQCDGTGWMLVRDDKGICYMRECRCHYDLQITNKLKSAKVPIEFIDASVNSFKTDIYKMKESQERAAIAKKIAIKYVENYEIFKDWGKGLYLFSETKGSGKTRLAVSILNALIKKYDVRGFYIQYLLDEIKNTFNNSSHSAYEIIRQFTEAELLVVDDFAVEKATDWSEEMFTKILNDRMNYKRPTIITSNIQINQLSKKYRAGRIESRIEKMTFPVHLPDENVRSYLAQQENERIAEFIFSF